MLSKLDSAEPQETASVEDCMAFILQTAPQAAVHSVIRMAAAVGALALCSNSNIELQCLQASQCMCIDTHTEFTSCPVSLSISLSCDPSITLGSRFEPEHCQPISLHACSSAFKDVLTESSDRLSPPSGAELAWVLCLLAGCGAEAALLSVAAVEQFHPFSSLSCFCDQVSNAASAAQSLSFLDRVSNFKASVIDWIDGNFKSLSALFLSPANCELLSFVSGVPDSKPSSRISLIEHMDDICAETASIEVLNLCRHIAGDNDVALNSNIKYACRFISQRSTNIHHPIQFQVPFLWAVVDSWSSTLKSLSAVVPSQLSSAQLNAAAATRAQLLLQFSIACPNLDPSVLNVGASFCVSSIEAALRSSSGSGFSSQHLISNACLLCLAVRKGAIPEQRHKLRSIAQSTKSVSAHASSIINSLFEPETSALHDDELQALEAELSLWYDRVKEARSSQKDQGIIADLKESAGSVLRSLSEELWVCHCALMASCFFDMNDSSSITPVPLVPLLDLSISHTAPKVSPSQEFDGSDLVLSQDMASSTDLTSDSVLDFSQGSKSLSPAARQFSEEAAQPASSLTSKIGCLDSDTSPLCQAPSHIDRFSRSIKLPSHPPVDPCAPIIVSRDQLSCPARKLDAHESAVNAIVISADRTFLFTAGDDCTIKKWQLDICYCIKSVLADHAVLCLVASSDGNVLNVRCPVLGMKNLYISGQHIFSGGSDIVVWSADLRRVHTLLKGCQHPIMSIALSTDLVVHATNWYR
jgi:hypothetical protein